MNAALDAFLWAAATLGIYAGSLALHRRHARWWSSPLLVTWTACGALILVLRSSYADYLTGTRWLMLLLGPATIAFALPIHRHREIIRKHAAILAIGVVLGSALSAAVSWGFAWWLHFSPELRASLLPRSVTTPLAMAASEKIGGLPGLTAAFTAITGLFGASIGELLLARLPFRSAFARGALFGMGAHGAGVAKARELGEEEGVAASLIMIFAGLLNVLAATLYGMS